MAQTQPGPFGLRLGMTLSELQKLTNLESKGNYVYLAKRLPNGHPEIDEYRLVVTPQHGLCKISAWTDAIKSNSYGEQLRQVYKRFFDALSAKYGNSKSFDFLRVGSIWNEPRDFMMGLAKRDRNLASYWEREERSNMPSDMTTISLTALAVDGSTGLVEIAYDFGNITACLEWRKNQRDSSL